MITGSASTGTNTCSRRPTARASTAAARAALPQLAIARSGRAFGPASPSRSETSRWSRTPMRCRPLCDPATLPVSSLTHTPPAALNPRRSERTPTRPNGVTTKPRPSMPRTASSSRLTSVGELVVGHAPRRWRGGSCAAARGTARTVDPRRRKGNAPGQGRGRAPARGRRRPFRRSGTGTDRGPRAAVRRRTHCRRDGWRMRSWSRR